MKNHIFAFVFLGSIFWSHLSHATADNIEKLQVDAARGDKVAQNRLGVAYALIAGGIEKNLESALTHFSMNEVKKINDDNISIAYATGPGISVQERKRTLELIQIADNGDSAAQYKLALAYDVGAGGLIQNTSRALSYYEKAAEQGNGAAASRMGDAFIMGAGLGGDDFRSDEKVMSWYKKGAALGNLEAELGLAVSYMAGMKNLPADSKEAIRYYTLASARGSSNAQYNLAVIYQKGIGIPRDDKKAFELFMQAADAGHIDAALNLAICYERALGIAKDPASAEKWRTKAKNTMSDVLKMNFGLIMYDVNRDAFDHDPYVLSSYRQAAFFQNSIAEYKLSNAYRNGLYGVSKDTNMSKLWLNKSILRGNHSTIMSTTDKADTEDKKILVIKSYESISAKAKEEFMQCLTIMVARKIDENNECILAAEHGNAEAQFFLAQRYLRGDGVKQNEKKALKWLRESAQQDNAGAQFSLSTMYAGSSVLPWDSIQSYVWLNLSAAHGNRQAIAQRLSREVGMTAAQIDKAQQKSYEWYEQWVH